MDNKVCSLQIEKNLNTCAIGKNSESLALNHLKGLGYRCIAVNFRWKGGELDLVCFSPEGELVFVEVRSSSTYSPWLKYSIGRTKQMRLQRTIQRFLFTHPENKKYPKRFDVIWVEAKRCEHWKNIQLG